MVSLGKKDRYHYQCSREQLRKRPLTLHILEILTSTKTPRMTKQQIIKQGQQKYRDWPQDPVTVFRALKTMTRDKFLIEHKRGQGQATLWCINKKQPYEKELIIHELHQIEHHIENLPSAVFTARYFKDNIERIQDQIRTLLVDLEKQDSTLNQILLEILEEKLFSTPESTLLDKQLSIIFLFCMRFPKLYLLEKWFDTTQSCYRVTVDFQLADVFQQNFYPTQSRKDIICLLDKHNLPRTLSEKLRTMLLLYYGVSLIEYEHEFELFDKKNIPHMTTLEIEGYKKNISDETNKLFMKRVSRTDALAELFKEPKFTIEQIDEFIVRYQTYFVPVSTYSKKSNEKLSH